MGIAGGGEGMLDPMGMAEGGEGGRRPRRGRGEEFAPNPMDMPAPSGGFDNGMNAGTQSAVNPESILGYEATEATAQETRAVVLMAVVPYEKQVEEFQNALASSLDYDKLRDSPMYLKYYVERADVTDDPAADPATLKWDSLSVNAALDETANWAGALQEIVDPAYLDERLTHPAPPFMQRELWDLLTHPEVPLPPMATAETTTEGRIGPRVRPGSRSAPKDDAPTLDDFGPPRSAMGGFNEGQPMPGMPMGRGPTMSAGAPAGAEGSPMGMGMPGSEYGYAGSGVSVALPKYKLIRFTDTTVEAGRKYRYRLKILLHDPNHPHTNYTPPSPASLDPKVRERVKSLDAKTFYVTSEDWSDPSPVVSLPSPYQYFAGSVTQPPTSEIVPGKPRVPNTVHPEAKALAVVWDPTKVADVGAETKVYRGSILNFVKDVDVIHPVTHQVVNLSKYTVATNAIVADILGGDEIPLLDKRSDKPPLTAPGELLIFDAEGNLHVQNETDDIEGFRRYLVPEAPDVPAGGSPMGEAGGEFGSILEGMPMPGMAPPPVRPRR
jgi:hypothetical protein